MDGALQKNFIGYEYRDITVKKIMQSVYADSFGNFGWIAEGIGEAVGKVDSVVMKFKRDRKIRNKSELTRLQRQFEACTAEIVSLEKSKVTKAAAITGIFEPGISNSFAAVLYNTNYCGHLTKSLFVIK